MNARAADSRPPATATTLKDLIAAAMAAHEEPAGEDPARARRRRRLVEAATELFLHHGYRKTSVDDVARRAGVAKGTVYLYFASKADLLIACLFAERKRFMELLLSLWHEDATGRERLRSWLRTLLLSLEESPLTVRFLGGDHEMRLVLEDLDPSYIEQIMDMKIGLLASMIGDACEEDRMPPRHILRQRATVLVATFNASGFFVDDSMRFGLDLETFSDVLCDILLQGVCAWPTAPTADMPEFSRPDADSRSDLDPALP